MAQNTTGRDEVVVGDSKHKGIAPKQDISEDHRKVKKTQPSRPFLAILSVRKAVQRLQGCGCKELFLLKILSGRTSKTEFVCKRYGQSKFAVQNSLIRTKFGLD